MTLFITKQLNVAVNFDMSKKSKAANGHQGIFFDWHHRCHLLQQSISLKMQKFEATLIKNILHSENFKLTVSWTLNPKFAC